MKKAILIVGGLLILLVAVMMGISYYGMPDPPADKKKKTPEPDPAPEEQEEVIDTIHEEIKTDEASPENSGV